MQHTSETHWDTLLICSLTLPSYTGISRDIKKMPGTVMYGKARDRERGVLTVSFVKEQGSWEKNNLRPCHRAVWNRRRGSVWEGPASKPSERKGKGGRMDWSLWFLAMIKADITWFPTRHLTRIQEVMLLVLGKGKVRHIHSFTANLLLCFVIPPFFSPFNFHW